MGPVSTLPASAPPSPEGSNNWVVSASKTATGRPILANDPHRAMTVPSLRYIVHLKCPEFDAIGAGEPALPGIAIGHNGSVAFGLTIWNVDQEDLYVYELNPQDRHLYRYHDTWVRMDRRIEKVHVKDARSAEVELLFTRHGPVIHIDEERNTAYALRAAWLEAGMAPYLSSLGNLYSKTATDVRSVLNRWGGPGVNHVYADKDGSIGWSPRALVPIRPNWDGLLPVPGDGRYEWDGFRHASALPQVIDPPAGYVASANQMNLPGPEEWSQVEVSYEWYAPYRMQRIEEVLSADVAITLATSTELQNDYVSTPARTVCSLLSEDPFSSEASETGRLLLKRWDHKVLAESAAALLFETWFRTGLRERLLADALARSVKPELLERAVHAAKPQEHVIGDAQVDMRLLEECGRDPVRLREVLEETLGAAVTHLRNAYGLDPEKWQWGSFASSRLDHLAADHFDETPDWARIGPYPKSGSSETVGLSAPSPANGVEVTGASFRMVLDVGQWDNSLAINTPGQDGDPRSPHYSDLYEAWHADRYFPLLYSQAAIAQRTSHKIEVRPIRQPRSSAASAG
jgi:penicillin amidase